MVQDTFMEREQLRRRVRELRSAQERSEAARKSSLICAWLRRIPELQKASTIMAYDAIKGEADIAPYWYDEWSRGKTVVLPRVKGDQLETVEFTGRDQLEAGPFGLREPGGEAFPAERIEAVLVPGVVFDRQGYRLGYGKGYYDRFLPSLNPASFCCGIAYELQLAADVHPTDRDVRLLALVTESRIIRVSSS